MLYYIEDNFLKCIRNFLIFLILFQVSLKIPLHSFLHLMDCTNSWFIGLCIGFYRVILIKKDGR